MAEQLVQHHLRLGIAAQFDHHPEALAVALVAQVGDALDGLGAHQIGDALQHARLVHLIGYLGDDDRLAVLADLLDLGPGPHPQAAAPGVIGIADAGAAQDHPAGWEIRAGDQLHQRIDADLGPLDVGQAAVDHLAQIVGRDVGGHAHGDAAGAVDQQVGKARRQDHRLLGRLVVVVLEIDGVLVDVVQQGVAGRPGQPRLGVAHGRRRVAVHRAEVALAVDQRQAHGEVLRHAHHGVVDRRIAVGVVLAHYVADHAGGLAVGPVPVVARFLHGIENAPVHRLQAVAHVRQGAGHDHAHGVIEVGAPHLVFDGDRRDVVIGGRL